MQRACPVTGRSRWSRQGEATGRGGRQTPRGFRETQPLRADTSGMWSGHHRNKLAPPVTSSPASEPETLEPSGHQRASQSSEHQDLFGKMAEVPSLPRRFSEHLRWAPPHHSLWKNMPSFSESSVVLLSAQHTMANYLPQTLPASSHTPGWSCWGPCKCFLLTAVNFTPPHAWTSAHW